MRRGDAAGVAAEALGVRGQRPRLTPENVLPDPDEPVGDRPPRAECPPDVAEQQRQHGHADPEDDVHPGRGDVAERIRRAEERGGEDDDEQERGERLDDDPHRPEHEPAECLAEIAPSACRSSCGVFHSAPSAMNETTRTNAPPQKKSHSGTGGPRTPRSRGRGRAGGAPDSTTSPSAARATRPSGGARARSGPAPWRRTGSRSGRPS